MILTLYLSTDHSLHPYLEHLPTSRQHSRARTQARTPHAAAASAASCSVPLAQLSSIILNMTFSDAEDEHHGTGNTGSVGVGRGVLYER